MGVVILFASKALCLEGILKSETLFGPHYVVLHLPERGGGVCVRGPHKRGARNKKGQTILKQGSEQKFERGCSEAAEEF